jgi:hypothetical protein
MPFEVQFGLNSENPHVPLDFFGPFKAGKGPDVAAGGHTYPSGGCVCVYVWVC